MPELPDVERYRRILETGGMRRRIAAVAVKERRILDRIAPGKFEAALEGVSFVETRRHGKQLLVRHDRGGWLTLHFGMTGRLEFRRAREEPPTYTRVLFDFEDDGHLAYVNRRMIGRVGLTDDVDSFIREKRLGPDALDPELDRGAFIARLRGTRRGAKAVLMDQSVVAGIGNIWSDEILFQVGVHPKTPIAVLDDAALGRLHGTMRRVLEVAVERGAGSEEFHERLPRGYLLRARFEEGKCPRCGGELATLKVGGRTAWYCPRCQPEPGT